VNHKRFTPLRVDCEKIYICLFRR